MTEITFKVNTRELQRKLNELDLSGMTPTELESFIRENLQVTMVKSETERRAYVSLKNEAME